MHVLNILKPAIKLYWWRDAMNGKFGNFGDEITREIIRTVYSRRVKWAPPSTCEIIGAGSIIIEVTQNKGSNRPYLWTSGFIQPSDLTISDNDYKIIGVRGKLSLKRVQPKTHPIIMGDAGLLASYLLKRQPKKEYTLGIIAHYVDKNHPFVLKMLGSNPSIRIIDATWHCQKVIEEIAKCDSILSSSLHGLIVSDSLGVPNIHLQLSDKLTGGQYKFKDYYSIYQDPNRYQTTTPDLLATKSPEQIKSVVAQAYVPIPIIEIQKIKNDLIESFPFR